MRAETGAMQFGDDWRGVFIRGDNAFGYATYLKSVLDDGSRSDVVKIYEMGLGGLLDLLLSSDERSENTQTQKMKPFAECVADPPETERE